MPDETPGRNIGRVKKFVAKCIAIEQSYKDVEALQGRKESNPVDLLSQSRPDKKLKPKREAKPPE